MALELKDFRLGITAEIDAALTARSRAFDMDRGEVAREVLGAWAARIHLEARVMTALTKANGIEPASIGSLRAAAESNPDK